jgi:hypothetical protein
MYIKTPELIQKVTKYTICSKNKIFDMVYSDKTNGVTDEAAAVEMFTMFPICVWHYNEKRFIINSN